MFFDFAARPPEINSALMYSGAGAGPMVAAAAAFSNLSGELSATAASYQSVISQLTGSAWQGPSAAAMAAAAEPYITWLSTTSGQLQHAASQAIASAAAYETAFAATVPPPVIAANRAQLAMLVSTNFLGQNTPAIAANEAQYAEMWAQDAAAMYGYAASSAAAAQLTPVTPPAETTNPAGLGAQAAAVSNAVSSSATTSGLNGVLSSLTNAQGALANPLGLAANASSGTSIWQGLNDLMNTGIVFNSINSVDVTASWCTMMTISAMATLGHFISNAPAGVTVGDVTPLGAGLGGGILASSAAPAAGGYGAAPVAAGMGQASLVGRLSVPGTWSSAAPAASAAAEFEGSGWTVAPEEEMPVATVPAGMPSVASAGRSGYGFGTPRYGVKPTVMPKTVLV
ncbi:PPE family protein [Mycobacterium xenopi]|uniref:PPE family protein n=1 Tax=Mycobacterium xenopi TaxID=1789 RepID=UPI00025AEBCD|nr:PPE family protein [Mycobacterium xenopi]EID11168.1 PPE family protein [Mycobacterium xenopi RIVM700367]MDA3661676.1 PPE family protein [Mycobacterium xenopi]